MFSKFDNVTEDIFPQDISIELSLSEISGTLLYSIDKNRNQMIVSLYYSVEATLAIEFRRRKNYISLSELCGCENCQYEMLKLFIEIKDTINLKCNNRTIQKYPYSTEKELNPGFPLPYSNKQVNSKSQNEAHLWLVNHQSYTNLYPNQDQMVGCIFEVKYKNNPINFTTITNNIGRQCKKKCVDNICNGGICHETYNGRAVCNCTETFLNGLNCNDTFSQLNIRAYGLSFKFNLLKVSWKSMSKEIFALSYKNLRIELTSPGNILLFKIKYSNNFNTVTNSLTFWGYVPNKETIFIASLSDKKIDVKILYNGIWHFGNLDSKTDLRKETFTNLTLRSEGGIIGLANKPLSKNHKWRNVEIENFDEIKNELSNYGRNSLQKGHNTTQYFKFIIKNPNIDTSIRAIDGVFIGFFIVLVGIPVFLLYIKRRNKNFKDKNKTNGDRENLITQTKEFEGFCNKSEEKECLQTIQPDLKLFGFTNEEKLDLYKALNDPKKYTFTENEKETINNYLNNQS